MKRFSLIVVFLFIGCAMLGTQPWHLDIQNWEPKQKANFFMNAWLAEKSSYDSLNAMENKPESLIKVLQAKRDVLEKSRIPTRAYVKSINAGGAVDPVIEQEIIQWLIQLQQMIIYGG